MDFKILVYIQRFIVVAVFTAATIIWYNINNERPTLYKCRHAVKFILMMTFILVIKAFSILPDPQNIRLLLQHLLTTVIAIGFFFEIKKVYKKNILRRKKEIEQVVENPVKKEVHKEIIRPELKRLGGLRKLILTENEKLEKKKENLEEWEDKLGDLKDDLEIEKEKLKDLNKEIKLKEKELQKMDEHLQTRHKKVEKKEKNYGKKELKLKEKLNEIKEVNQKIEEERKDIDKKVDTMKLLEEDIKDKKEDIVREKKKLEELKK